jgi:hypothetical protein
MAHKSITFFNSEAAAIAMTVKGDMTEAEGFYVVPAVGRPGCFVIEFRDPEDGFVIGNI